uniref:protein GAMETE EXPRESSED 3 n=1 Tax=Erigeron canadensis TaxID=72917 RepID=UPI001CB92213|nr:protein GAMETE EXPRESSED 3 [Erigeron canadensis]
MSLFLGLLICIFTIYMSSLVSAASDSGFSNSPTFSNLISEEQHVKFTKRLPNPLTNGDEEKIYICMEKNFLVFENNGSISKQIPLNYTCNAGITPVLGASGKVYLVAENRVLQINTMNVLANESVVEVFLGPEKGLEGMDEIIGMAVSITSSCVIVNMNRRGLFAFRLDGKLIWSAGPVITQMGYFQGCRKDVTDCYFVSVPVLDHCDANIYVSNNQGELYSVSMRGPYFKWIQDLSSLGGDFFITAGNNGQLYVTVQDKPVVLALDVITGNVIWQQSVGPLSSNDSAPVVDANGWVSIGSLDGYLYSISPSGVVTKFPRREIRDAVIQVNPVLDCSGLAVYISQTKMEGIPSQNIGEYTYVSGMKPLKIVFTLLVPATGSVYWSESYPGELSSIFPESGLRNFVVDGRILLPFLSISNIGNPLSCFSTSQKLTSSCSKMDVKKVIIYTGNEKTIELFLFFETILLIVVAALVRFCCVFWKKKKLQNQNLRNFLEKRSSLRFQKKVFDRTITELEKKAAEGPSTNEMLEQLDDLVKERETIERKLLTTYSLGRDTTSPEPKPLLPLSDKKTKSFSNKTEQKDSVTMFNTMDDTSSEDGESNEEVDKTESKGKAPLETESSSDDDETIVPAQGVKILDEKDDLQIGGTSVRRRFFYKEV